MVETTPDGRDRHRTAGCRAGLRLPRPAAVERARWRRCGRCCASQVPHLSDDRHFHPDMAAAALVRSRLVIGAVGAAGGDEWRSSRGAAKRHRPGTAHQAPGGVPDRDATGFRDDRARGDAPTAAAKPPSSSACRTPAPRSRPEIEARLVSPWLARKDADWWVDRLYAFADRPGRPRVLRTAISRTVIDVNRDPSGASLYPGQTTTEPVPDHDLRRRAAVPRRRSRTTAEIDAPRRRPISSPITHALPNEIAPARGAPDRVVLYEAHSIRSHVPRLFDGELPQFNLGTNSGGKAATTALTGAVEAACDAPGTPSSLSRVTNGRFKGGWTTRHYGRPVHGRPTPSRWSWPAGATWTIPAHDADAARPGPPPIVPTSAAPMRAVLEDVLRACLNFADTT